MQAAEEIGSTLATVKGSKNSQAKNKQPVFIPVNDRNDNGYAPMEIGAMKSKFEGECWLCGRKGHRAADCWSGGKPRSNNATTSR